MSMDGHLPLRPGEALLSVVQQTIEALIALDSDRLEELADQSMELCPRAASIFKSPSSSPFNTSAWERDLPAVTAGIHLLGRVLSETRANLDVVRRISVQRSAESNGPPYRVQHGSNQSMTWFDSPYRGGRSIDYGDN